MNRETVDSDREQRLNEVLLAYVEAAQAGGAPDRHRLLAAHPDLRAELEEFFASHDEVERLAAPLRAAADYGLEGASALHDPPCTTHPGDAPPALGQLGDFRLLREVGRGGMGIVYEGEQISLRRRVALKMLPFAGVLDPKQLQRFKREVQAAAHLDHPNIVHVYFVGSERGVHYYAMQFIEGQSLAEMIQQMRQQAQIADRGLKGRASNSTIANRGPTNDTQPRHLRSSIDPRSSFFHTVAQLGVQAAEALEHAHGLGVVHRDIKPGNLLADASGKLWITDFGLAQFQSEAGLTRTGDLVGTLRYMSPEQALAKRGLVDHRADLYSLGATLYELLTLEPAFNGCDREELLRQIAFEELRPPRRLNRAIPADLETIVLKAMAKSVEERYATAQELADDLHRFLRHEPILARRPTLAQRARKWLRRHPSVLVAGSVLLVLLAVGSLFSAWLIQGAYERERQRAEEAEKQFALARRAADDMIQMAEGDLADDPHSSNLRRQLLEAALAYYQEFIEQRRDDPRAQQDLEVTRDRVKKIIADLAVLQGAGQFVLLNNPAVLDDLGLPETERGRIAALLQRLAEQRHDSLSEFHRLTAAQRRQCFLDLARSEATEVAAILSPEQVNRLRQIALQIAGPMAFRDPDIAAVLNLTAEQRERIRAIEAEVFPVRLEWRGPGEPPPERQRGEVTRSIGGQPGRAFGVVGNERQKGEAGWSMGGEWRGPGGLPPELPEKPHPQNIRAARDKMLAVLTKEQKAKWEEMTGPPFKGKLPLFFGARTAFPPGPFGEGVKEIRIFSPP